MELLDFWISIFSTFFTLFIGVVFFIVMGSCKTNYPVYCPLKYLQNEQPHSGFGHPFLWLKEAWKASDQELIHAAGLDAVVYIKFLEAALLILSITALYCVPVLICITVDNKPHRYSKETSSAFYGFDKFTLRSIQDKSPEIWAFVVGAYWLSLVTSFVLWFTFKKVASLRVASLLESRRSRVFKPEEFVVLLQKIPLGVDDCQAQVDAHFRSLFPGTYEKSIPVFDIHKVKKQWHLLISANRKLTQAKTMLEITGEVPHHRLGLKDKFKSVDSVSYYTNLTQSLEKIYSEELELTKQKKVRAVLVIFNSPISATLAGYALYGSSGFEWQAVPISDHRGIRWERFSPAMKVIVLKNMAMRFAYTIAIATFLGLLNRREDIQKLQEKDWFRWLQDVLPALALKAALHYFLGPFSRKVVRLTNVVTWSGYERYTIQLMFLLEVLSTIISVAQWQGTPYNAASFFMTFTAFSMFGFGYQFSRLIRLLNYRRLLAHNNLDGLRSTPEELQETWYPAPFDYMSLIPTDLLMLTIAMSYAVMAPIVLLFVLIYFLLEWTITRHEALKVKLPRHESGGKMWPHMHRWIVAAVLYSQLELLYYIFFGKFGPFLHFCVSSLHKERVTLKCHGKHDRFCGNSARTLGKFGYGPFITLLPLPLLTLGFGIATSMRFWPVFKRPLLEFVNDEAVGPDKVSEISDAFTPECIVEQGFLYDVTDYAYGDKPAARGLGEEDATPAPAPATVHYTMAPEIQEDLR